MAQTNPFSRYDSGLGAEDDETNPFSRYDAGDGEPGASGMVVSPSQAFWSNAGDILTVGAGDEIVGGLEGFRAALSGGDFALAYRRRVDEARNRLQAAREQHPIESMAGSFLGAAPWMLVGARTGGVGAAPALRAAGAVGGAGVNIARAGMATRAAQGVGRVLSGEALPFGRQLMNLSRGTGLPAIIGQGLQGMRQGAIYGGLYGGFAANTDSWSPDDWGGAALGGAGPGMLWGGLTPPVLQGVGRGKIGDRLGAAIGAGAVRAGAGAVAGYGIGTMAGADPLEFAKYGALGGVIGKPVYSRTIGPVFSGLRQAWRNPRAAFGGGTGMSIGLPMGIAGDDAANVAAAGQALPDGAPAGGGRGLPPWRNDILERTPPPERASPAVVRAFAKLAREEGITDPAQLRDRVAYAIRNPMGRTWADIFGKPGTLAARGYAQGRGVGPALAEARLQERKSGLLQLLMGETPRRLGVRKTPMKAGESIDEAYERISEERYNPILNGRRIEGEHRAKLDDIVKNRFDEDLLRAAESMMRSMARMRGNPTPRPGDARYYHALYSALGHTVRHLERSPTAIQGRLFGPEQLEAARQLHRVMEAALADAIEGYGPTRKEWGGLFAAKDKMDEGRNFIRGALPEDDVSGGVIWRQDEFERYWDGLTDFDRNHFRIGVADELQRKFRFGVNAVGNANFAKAFNVDAMQDLLSVVFDSPAQAQRYFQVLNEGNQLLGDAITWGGGSPTAANLARAGRGMFASALEEVSQSGIAGATQKLVTKPLRSMSDSVAQIEDNESVTALLARMDDRTRAQRRFRRDLFARLQAQLAQQQANARSSIQSGIFSGFGAGADDAGTDYGY